MRCHNQECGYEFFEREEHYICCPKCGEVVSENFPSEGSFKRGKAYLDVRTYNKYLKKEMRFACIVGIMYIGLEFMSGEILFDYVRPSLNYIPHYAISNVERTRFLCIFLPMILFTSYVDKYEIYKKLFGEITWICRLEWFKIIKAVVLLVFAIFMTTKIIPNFYDQFPKVFAHCKNSSSVKIKLTILYHITLWYMYTVVVISDINDIYKRRWCDRMSV